MYSRHNVIEINFIFKYLTIQKLIKALFSNCIIIFIKTKLLRFFLQIFFESKPTLCCIFKNLFDSNRFVTFRVIQYNVKYGEIGFSPCIEHAAFI